MFARATVALNCRVVPCVVLRSFPWLAGLAVTPDAYCQPTAGVPVGLVCVVIFLSPQGRNHFLSGADPVRAACILPHLWHLSGWIPAKGGLEGGVTAGEFRNRVPSVSRASLFCPGRNLELLWRGAKGRLEGVGLQKCAGAGCAVSELGGEYLCYSGSCRCHYM